MTGILPIPIPRVPFIRSTPVLVIVAGMLVLGVPTARAQGPSDPSTIYRLNPDSSFQQGCFAPCMCPIRLGTVVRGTFVLTPTGIDGAFTTYAVTDVNWIVGSGDRETRVTGSGTYKVGGDLAVQQELTLDLTIEDNPIQHFDSGLVSGGGKFPEIDATVSMHGQVCFDTVFFGAPQPLSGTFALVDLRRDPLFTEFAVVSVDWLMSAAPDPTGTPVRGVGTYRVGGEVAAQQQLSLALWVGDDGPTRFDSGLVAGGGDFPRIDIRASVNGLYCFDTLIDLDAASSDQTLAEGMSQ